METGDSTSTFIVRLWSSEPMPADDAIWRGSIDDVSRARRLYFTNLGAMVEFIVEQRRLPKPPSEKAKS